MFRKTPRLWTSCAAILLALGLGLSSAPPSFAQTTLADLPDVSDALKRFTGGHNYASKADKLKDQALLFANNDAINAARQNNHITDSAYQAAQADFAKLNSGFAEDAANRAGAAFEKQITTSDTFSPGADSDYITKVKNKEQIGKMQNNYNDNVNKFLQDNGAIDKPRNNWQKKLDTDFMADPKYITDPGEFREIAKMNNDAYKNRYAAEYEKLSRQKSGGKIGPKHVTGYADEMADFAKKKRGKIAKMLKNPSLFNDPKNRAKVIQMMAQEQKYISRIESLDDYLRAQEGLTPRNRGTTMAAQGAKRQPHNVRNLKDAYAVTEASQGKALEDLAETMGKVAKGNKEFRASAVDDLAKIIANAPPEHQAKALAALKRSNPDLAKIVKARNPGFGSVDDLARTGGKASKVARTGDSVSDLAKLSKARKLLRGALKTLEVLGKATDIIEVAMAVAELKGYIAAMEKALDPATPPEEVAALSKKAAEIAVRLHNSVALIHIMNKHPTIAAIYGAVTVACLTGDWIAGDVDWGDIPRPESQEKTCSERHISAWNRFTDWAIGEEDAEKAVRQAQCQQIKLWLARGSIKFRYPYDIDDVCWALDRGEQIADMLDNEGADLARRCAALEGRVGVATSLVDKGDLSTAHNVLSRARSQLGELGAQACPGLDDRIAGQETTITNEAASQRAKVESALSECRFSESAPIIAKLPGPEQEAMRARSDKVLETEVKASELIAQAKELEDQGKPEGAAEKLRQARALSPCKSTIAEIDKAIGRSTQTRTASGSKGKQCDAEKLAAPKPTASYILCGPPSTIYSSCLTLHCKTNQELSAYLSKRPDFKIKKNLGDCPTPNKEARTAAACTDLVKRIEKDEKPPVIAQPSECVLAENHYQKARTAYTAGDADAYETGLTQAGEAMAKSPGGSCDGLAAKITKGHEQADVLKKVNTTAGKLLSSCKGSDPRTRAAQLRELSGLLSKTKQPHVQELSRRLDAAYRATSAYADAKGAFKLANLDSASRHLGNARTALGAVDTGDCPGLRAAISKAPFVFDNWRKGVRDVANMTASCTTDDMERYRSKLSGMSSPIAATLVARLAMALPECDQRRREAELARKKKDAEERQASCEAGYHPGPVLADGKYYCLPTQETADAWCKNNNPGSGYRAGAIKNNGAHDCRLTKAGLDTLCRDQYGSGAYAREEGDQYRCLLNKTARNRSCRQQYGRGWYSGKPKRDGSFLCYGQRKRTTTVRRRRRRSRQPNISAQDIARGLSVLGGVINQMQRGSRRGGGGGGCSNPLAPGC